MSKITLLFRPLRPIRPIILIVGVVSALFAFSYPLTPLPSFTLIVLSPTHASAASVSVCGADDPFCLKKAAEKGEVKATGTDEVSLASAIGKIIQMLLSLIGVLFFGLMFWGGFRWMTARGDQESAEDGKKTLENGVLGFLVVLIAYALTTFIVSELFTSPPAVTAPAAQPTPGAKCLAKAPGAKCIKAFPDCKSLKNYPHNYSDIGPEDCSQTPEPLTCCVPP